MISRENHLSRVTVREGKTGAYELEGARRSNGAMELAVYVRRQARVHERRKQTLCPSRAGGSRTACGGLLPVRESIRRAAVHLPCRLSAHVRCKSYDVFDTRAPSIVEDALRRIGEL